VKCFMKIVHKYTYKWNLIYITIKTLCDMRSLPDDEGSSHGLLGCDAVQWYGTLQLELEIWRLCDISRLYVTQFKSVVICISANYA